MLVYLHGGIMCVQQDIWLRYHKSNQDYYLISHTGAPKSSSHVHMENKKGFTKGTERTLESRKNQNPILPRASQRWRRLMFPVQETQERTNPSVHLFSAFRESLPPTHTNACFA